MSFQGPFQVTEPEKNFPYRVIETNGFTDPAKVAVELKEKYFTNENVPGIVVCKRKDSAKCLAQQLQKIMGNAVTVKIVYYRTKIQWKESSENFECHKDTNVFVAFTDSSEHHCFRHDASILQLSFLSAIFIAMLLFIPEPLLKESSSMCYLLMFPVAMFILSLANILLFKENSMFRKIPYATLLSIVVGLVFAFFTVSANIIGFIIAAGVGGLFSSLLFKVMSKDICITNYISSKEIGLPAERELIFF